MKLVTGKVVAGKVVVEEGLLDEGALVTVLAPESESDFELGPAEEAELLAAMDEARRGHVVSAEEVLRKLSQAG